MISAERESELVKHSNNHYKMWHSITSGKFGFDTSHTQEWWKVVKNRDQFAIVYAKVNIQKHLKKRLDFTDYAPSEWVDDIAERIIDASKVLHKLRA